MQTNQISDTNGKPYCYNKYKIEEIKVQEFLEKCLF